MDISENLNIAAICATIYYRKCSSDYFEFAEFLTELFTSENSILCSRLVTIVQQFGEVRYCVLKVAYCAVNRNWF